jgi:hypothetical protein
LTQFEYVSVLVSILIAFGISEILSGWGHLIRTRHAVRFYWLHAAWSVFLLLLLVQFWSGMWEYRSRADWSYFAMLAVLLDALPLIAVAVLLTPGSREEGDLDLREYYFRMRPWVFGLGAFTMLQLAVVDASIGGQPLLHPENAVRGAGAAVALTLALSRSERVHGVLAVLCFLLLGVFTAIAFHSAAA